MATEIHCSSPLLTMHLVILDALVAADKFSQEQVIVVVGETLDLKIRRFSNRMLFMDNLRSKRLFLQLQFLTFFCSLLFYIDDDTGNVYLPSACVWIGGSI
jgi:hypothetical protein